MTVSQPVIAQAWDGLAFLPLDAVPLVRLLVCGEWGPRELQPVTVGVPFPRASLANPEGLALLDSAGQPLPLQATPLAHWPDGSLKWVLLDSLLRPENGSVLQLALRRLADRVPGAARLEVTETPEGFFIDTGVAQFHLGRSALRPFDRVVVGGENVVGSGAVVSRPVPARVVAAGVPARVPLPRQGGSIQEIKEYR